jgi:hypothetical protein
VCLKALDSVVPDDKPEFESSKPFAQRNLPMLKGRKTIIIKVKNTTIFSRKKMTKLPDASRMRPAAGCLLASLGPNHISK